MKIKHFAAMGIIAAATLTSCNNKFAKKDSLESEIDSVSYGLGLDMASKVKQNFINANDAAFVDGFKAAADTTSAKVAPGKLDNLLRAFFMKQQQEAIARAQDSTATEPVAENENTTAQLLSNYDTVSYALGLDMALKMDENFAEISDALFVQGYEEFGSETALLQVENVEGVLRAFFTKKQQEQMAEQQKKAEEEAMKQYAQVKEEGLKFLAENKAKEGVKVTSSGLQYKVIKEGNGSHPAATDNVTVHYHGTTPDGTVFDSSVDRGEPTSFALNQVIKGWTEGLQLMGEGAKYTFYIPQELAYGSRGAGGTIKPFMPLVFEVELIKINK